MGKTLYMEKLCINLKLPMIKVVDGASGGGSITTYRTQGGSYLPDLHLLQYLVGSSEKIRNVQCSFMNHRLRNWILEYLSVPRSLDRYGSALLQLSRNYKELIHNVSRP